MKRFRAKSRQSIGNKSWWERVLYYRKQRSFPYLIIRHWTAPDVTLKNRLLATYKECALLYHKMREIFGEIRQYGEVIKKGYGVSKVRQFYHMAYLKFVLGIPIENYRIYLLFKPDRWKSVDQFTYDNIESEQEIISKAVYGIDNNFHQNDDIFKDKVAFYNLCIEKNIPTPKILLEIKLSDQASNGDVILPRQDIFIKTIDGARGFGAAKFYYRGDGYEDKDGIYHNAKKMISSLQKSQYNSTYDRKEFIFQPVLENHRDWNSFTSGALATCRILTCKAIESDDIIPIAAILRMPSGNAIADNFSRGAIAAPISLRNGRLGVGVTYKPKDGAFEFDCHPDTKQQITGTLLPAWKELINFTASVHRKVNFIFVSWDISYTTEGFMVIEGNGLWDINILESPGNCPLLNTRYPEMYDSWIQYLEQPKSFARDTSPQNSTA